LSAEGVTVEAAVSADGFDAVSKLIRHTHTHTHAHTPTHTQRAFDQLI